MFYSDLSQWTVWLHSHSRNQAQKPISTNKVLKNRNQRENSRGTPSKKAERRAVHLVISSSIAPTRNDYDCDSLNLHVVFPVNCQPKFKLYWLYVKTSDLCDRIRVHRSLFCVLPLSEKTSGKPFPGFMDRLFIWHLRCWGSRLSISSASSLSWNDI